MKFQQSMMNYEISANCVLTVDFEAKRLEFEGDPDFEFDETFDSLDALDAFYQRKIAPYIRDNECYDIDESHDVEIIANLATFGEELAVRRKGEPIPEGADELDAAVIAFANALRERLNAAIGPNPLELSCVVFAIADSGIVGAALNGDLLAGKTEEEVEAMLEAHPHGGWQGEDFRRSAGLNLEYSPLLTPLEPYGEPYNLYGDAPRRLFFLACARLERDPHLRPNVSVSPNLRVYWHEHDELGIAWTLRREATAALDEPARAYFDRHCRG